VARRAGSRCEYCGLPEPFAAHRHEPDHVIALQHRGATVLENLALACLRCNRRKGPNIASIEAETGKLAALFNLRTQAWHEQFQWAGVRIEPLTPEGKVTERVLQLNDTRRLLEREALRAAGARLVKSWRIVIAGSMAGSSQVTCFKVC